MRRVVVALGATLALLIVGSPVAAQQEVIDALRSDPLYIAPGVQDVDRDAIHQSIAQAAADGLELHVAALSAGDAQQVANLALTDLGGTVAVFTPSEYFVVSDEVSQGRLDDALSAAADQLSGSDTAEGVAALVDELVAESSGGIPVGLTVLGVGVILLVVAVGGRIWDQKTRASRQAKRRDRRRTELTQKVQATGGEVVELSDAVELAESAQVSGNYAKATAIFEQLDNELANASSMNDLDNVAERLDEADSLLAEVRQAVRPTI